MKNYRLLILFVCVLGWFGSFTETSAQGTKVFDQEITWNWSPNAYGGYGFYWWHRTDGGQNIINYGDMSSTDWSNFFNGEFTMRFEVLEQPTNSPFYIQLGIWQTDPGGGHQAEQMASRQYLSGGNGSVWTGSLGAPSSWWVHPDGPGPVDFSSPESFYRIGLVLWNPSPLCIPMGHDWNTSGCPEYQSNFFSMRARVTVYAYSGGGSTPTQHTATFTVKDESNNPVSGANISVNGGNLTTNSSGVASTSLYDGNYNYTVSKSGYSNKSSSITVSGANVSENVTLTASSTPTYTVSFNVKDNSASAVQGAVVSIDGGNYSTDASGNTSVNLADGNYNYSVTKSGYANASGSVTVSGANVSRNITLTPTSGGSGNTVTFELIMEKYFAAVNGADITINGMEITTDATGKASIQLEDGTYPYTITRSGFEDLTGEVVMSGSNVTKSHTLLFGLYPITFTVTDASSNPIAGAEIVIPDVQKTKDESGNVVHNVAEVRKTTDANGQAVIEVMNDTYEYTVSKSGYADQSGSVFISGQGENESVSMTQTGNSVSFNVKDSDGVALQGATVSVDGNTLTTNASGLAQVVLNDGSYSYTVTKSGYDDATGSITVAGAAVTENVTLEGKPFSVLFRVKDASGSAIQGALVSVNGTSESTDSNGEATITLKNGTFNYTVSKDGYDNKTGSVTVASANLTEEVSLSQTAYTIAFVVVSDGNPVQGAAIDVEGESLTTNEQGQANLNRVNGSYDYVITKAGFVEKAGSVTVAGSNVTENVSLDQYYTLTFVVKNNETPVEGATISIDGMQTLTTDSQGRTSIDLLNGTYTYTITKAEMTSHTGSVTINASDAVKNVNMANLPYDFTFIVTDEASHPLEGAVVSVGGSDYNTAANGKAVASLTKGNYNYSISKPGYETANGSVEVEGEDGKEFVSLTQSVYDVTFTVTDVSSIVVEGAVISVDGQTLTTDALGQANLSLTAGTYSYTVTAAGFSEKTGSLSVVDQDIEETVTLEEAVFELSFIVKDAQGNPVAGAGITINDGNLLTDASGMATLSLVPGTYNYTVSKENFLDSTNSVVVSTEDVTLNIVLRSTVGIYELFGSADVDVLSLDNSEIIIRSNNQEFGSGYMFTIYTLQGKQIFSYENLSSTAELKISLPEQNSGVYILRIHHANQLFSKRFYLK